MDVSSKVNHIEQIYQSQPHQFQTLTKGIESEIRNNTYNTPDKKSATRTILRLVRALEFIIALLREVSNNYELVEAARKVLIHSFFLRR